MRGGGGGRNIDSYDDDEDEDEAIKSKKTNDGSKNSGSIKDPHNSNRRVFFSEDDSRDSSSEVVSPTIGPVLQTFQNSKARDAKQVSFNKWRNVSGNAGSSNNNSIATTTTTAVAITSQVQFTKKWSLIYHNHKNGNEVVVVVLIMNVIIKLVENDQLHQIKNQKQVITTMITNLPVVLQLQLLAPVAINSNKINEWQTGEHGLRYKDLKIGEGDPAVLGKKLRVAYEGKLTNTGQIFEKNNRGFEFPLGKGKKC